MAQHEIRLALVMNGGVSLAVWMAGVTHELDLARRASTPRTPGARPHDEAVASRWRELLRGRGSTGGRRLVIDVIAGTSAGGLNGALLATAIAHDSTLDPEPEPGSGSGPWLREQWCQLGALRYGRLIPDPADSGRAPTGSVLDGNFFLEQATTLLTRLAGGEEADDAHKVTLFTTASGLGQQEISARDAADQPFTVPDHRFLYRFTNDLPQRYDPRTLGFTAPETTGGDFQDIERLALAARSSASFPVAFAPRHEGERQLNTSPPRLRPRTVPGDPATGPAGEPVSSDGAWLMDGGVLDNAPFGPVLDTVSRCDVAGHVSRYVVYVVPSSGIGRAATIIQPEEGPPSWTTTALSAVQYPREVDFRSDIEELEALRLEADSAWSDSQRLFEIACADTAERERLLAAAGCLQPAFTRGRAAGGVWEALTIARSGRLTVLDESAAAPADDAAQILGRHPLWTPQESDGRAPLVVTTTGPDGAPLWPWGLGPAERVARTVLRRVRRRMKDAFDAPGGPDALQVRRLEAQLEGISVVRGNLRAVRTAAEEAMAALGTQVEGGPPAVTATSDPTTVTDAINEVYARLRVQQALGQQIRLLESVLPDGEGAMTVRTALAVEIVGRCTSSRTPGQRGAPFRFIRLGPDVGLPILGGEDQRTAHALGDHILYGTQVGHFGAFGAEGWRRWDWLLGRLHAVAHLGRILHDTSTPAGAEAATEWVRETQLAVLEAEGSSASLLAQGVRRLAEGPVGSAGGPGLGLMVDAMNEADEGRPQATQQVGDRLVHASGGLPAGLGRWVKVVAARSGPPQGRRHTPTEGLLRWFTEPARSAVWERLTGGRAELEPTTGWPVRLLSVGLWAVLAVSGLLGVVLLAVLADLAWPVVILAFLAAAATVLGLVTATAVWLLRRRRAAVASMVGARLGAGPSHRSP